MAPALLAATRCIPDGEIRDGCVVSDGATVRRRLKSAYAAIRYPDRANTKDSVDV